MKELLAHRDNETSMKDGYKTLLTELYDRFDDVLTADSGSPAFGGTGLSGRGAQQDATEYLNYILRQLDYSTHFSKMGERQYLVYADGHQKLNAPIDFSTDTYLPQIDLPIEGQRNIEGALNTYFTPEALSDCERAPGVKMDCQGTRFFVADPKKIPEYIFVNLRRFAFDRMTGTSKKIMDLVEVSKSIQLSFFDPGLKGGRQFVAAVGAQQKYKPIGVIVHQGVDVRSGHYYAYVYDPKFKAWHLHNDTSVQLVEDKTKMETDISTNGYIVLYAKE